MRSLLFAAAATIASASCAHAGPGETILRDRLSAARSAEAVSELSARGDRDQQVIFALGAAQFARAFEKFGQGLYRYGFAGINAGEEFGPALMALPVPPNPNPEPVSYDAIRALLAAFVNDLDEARATLARVESSSVKLRLDLMRVRLDLNGDGAGDVALGDFMGAPDVLPGRSGGRVDPQRTFAFDRADAIWLQGYSQLIAAQADFILAHDFHDLVNAVFHRLFPGGGLPLQSGEGDALMGIVNSTFADAIAAVHFINWPVVEPERRARVRGRLLDVARLSRANWAAIRAERDNDREWLPNPRQTSPFPDLQITDERIDAWLAFLDTWEAVLNGQQLVPHWRFPDQGVDMRRLFEGRENFDIVSILTGYGALPYLRTGEMMSMEEFGELTDALGPNAILFTFWFN